MGYQEWGMKKEREADFLTMPYKQKTYSFMMFSWGIERRDLHGLRFCRLAWKKLDPVFSNRMTLWKYEDQELLYLQLLIRKSVILRKIRENKGFHWPVFFHIRHNTGQWKPVFSHILCNVSNFIFWFLYL